VSSVLDLSEWFYLCRLWSRCLRWYHRHSRFSQHHGQPEPRPPGNNCVVVRHRMVCIIIKNLPRVINKLTPPSFFGAISTFLLGMLVSPGWVNLTKVHQLKANALAGKRHLSLASLSCQLELYSRFVLFLLHKWLSPELLPVWVEFTSRLSSIHLKVAGFGNGSVLSAVSSKKWLTTVV